MKCINRRSFISFLILYPLSVCAMEAPREPEMVVALKGHHFADSVCYTPNGKFLAAGILRREQPQALLKVWDASRVQL